MTSYPTPTTVEDRGSITDDPSTPSVVPSSPMSEPMGDNFIVQCAWCRRIKLVGERTYWARINLLNQRARISHGMCPQCAATWGAPSIPSIPNS